MEICGGDKLKLVSVFQTLSFNTLIHADASRKLDLLPEMAEQVNVMADEVDDSHWLTGKSTSDPFQYMISSPESFLSIACPGRHKAIPGPLNLLTRWTSDRF